jgi:SAM-dependent methyltransferase
MEPPLALQAFRGLVVAAQYRYLYDLTLRLLPTGSRVLDWGCGDGHFSHFLLGRGHRVDSFSLQNRPPLFDRLPAEWRARHAFTSGASAEPVRLPYRDQAFDAVFSVGVLEHVRETRGEESGCLREIHRILRPGSSLICSHLPNRYSLIEWASRRLFRDAPEDEHRRYHLYRFSRRDAVRLFEDAGFRVTLSRRYGFLPRNILGHLPVATRNSLAATRLANGVDRMLEVPLAAITQNLLIVGRRPAN